MASGAYRYLTRYNHSHQTEACRNLHAGRGSTWLKRKPSSGEVNVELAVNKNPAQSLDVFMLNVYNISGSLFSPAAEQVKPRTHKKLDFENMVID
jgi:hypothetical protein